MLRFFCACAMISTMLLMLLFKGGLDVKSVNELLKQAISESTCLQENEIFLVRDLFKDMNGIEYQEAIDCYWEHFF